MKADATLSQPPLLVLQEGVVEELRTEKGVFERYPKKMVTILQVRCRRFERATWGSAPVTVARVTWLAVGRLSSDIKAGVQPGQEILLFGYPHAIQGGVGNVLVVERWYPRPTAQRPDYNTERRRFITRAVYPAAWGPLAEITPEKVDVV